MLIFFLILTISYSNATYHWSEKSMKHLAFLNVPVLYSAPYSKYPILHLITA